MKVADIIVPRGGDNDVAINLIAKQVMTQLVKRGYDQTVHSQCRHELVNMGQLPEVLPDSLTIIRETPQVRGLHTFIRNKNTKRDELIFYAERLTRILVEETMNFMPYMDVEIELSNGQKVKGRRQCAQICGIAIMRAGETMEYSLRAVVKDCKMGKILIQTNEQTMEPELYYLRLPKDIDKYKVMLLDATVATGAAAMMAIRILLDHDVPEENIYVLSLLMSEPGVHALAYAFPKVRLITTAVDSQISDNFYVLPGMGNFGDRYYGTYASDTEAPLSQSSDHPPTIGRTWYCRTVNEFQFKYQFFREHGKILLPSSTLDHLIRYNVPYPMLFKVSSVCENPRATNCGVLEFSAPEGKCYLPQWMMKQLRMEEGADVRVDSVTLPSATYAKLKPQSLEFLNISNPRAVLEVELRKFACLTKNDVIAVLYADQVLEFLVQEVKPSNAVCIIECDLNLDFDAPEGYVESNQAKPSSNFKPPAPVSKPTVAPTGPHFAPFCGSGQRLDGKKKPSSSSLCASEAEDVLDALQSLPPVICIDDYKPGLNCNFL
ncbi:unnamed protein product [Nippostrongylus brasiliensis]|uniref:uridine/cytidine kinase n=1 Tax=Nippostrongylus brasiliensis TaxID=27835 RepID=A0A0N4YTH5_NIPBR|nr:unnamed protein product [Nippostrongylus brasiliensis]